MSHGSLVYYTGMTRVTLNNQAMQSHTEGDEPEVFKPWREADNLIKAGKLDEAAAHIKANVGEDEPVPESTLVIRVVMALGSRLTG